jgi:hypothetical protein
MVKAEVDASVVTAMVQASLKCGGDVIVANVFGLVTVIVVCLPRVDALHPANRSLVNYFVVMTEVQNLL